MVMMRSEVVINSIVSEAKFSNTLTPVRLTLN